MPTKIFLPLFIAILSINTVLSRTAIAQECSALFESDRNVFASIDPSVFRRSQQNAGDVLLSMFEAIAKAPKNSVIKVFDKSVRYDGIGTLLLMVSVMETRKSRGLKFEYYFEDSSRVSRLQDLYVESPKIKINYKATESNEFANRTLVVIESPKGVSSFQFNGDLSSESLKDSSLKGPIAVNYLGRNNLQASPFRKGFDVIESEFLSDEAAAGMVEAVKNLAEGYTINHVSKIDRMNDSDVRTVSAKANDLALQLYIHRNGRAPKEPLNTIGILYNVLDVTLASGERY